MWGLTARIPPIGLFGRKWATAAVFVECLAALTALSGCGGGGSSGPPPPPGTPAGTYSLTVIGISQGKNRTVALTLTVKLTKCNNVFRSGTTSS